MQEGLRSRMCAMAHTLARALHVCNTSLSTSLSLYIYIYISVANLAQAILAQAILAQVRNHFGSGVAVSPRRTAFGSQGAMGSKAQLGDIQRLLQNLHRQLGSDRLGGGRQGKGQGKGAKAGENWDCPHCADGIDNFASRTRCFKCGGNRSKNAEAKQANPKQAPRARSRPPKPSDRAPSATPTPRVETMDVDSTQEDAISELATARSLHDWARKLPQPARDKKLPAARRRLELAEGEDKKRKPLAERLQSALSRVDHRTRQAQAARDALSEAQQAIEVLEAECLHQDALLAKDQEELQVAQSLHQAWGPAAKEGAGTPSAGQQTPDPALVAEQAERQRFLLNRLFDALPPGQGPGLLKELAGSLGFPATQVTAQEADASQPIPGADPAEGSGPRKMPKQAKIKSQGPYARQGEATPGTGARSASAQGGQEEGLPEGLAEHGGGGPKPNSCEPSPEDLP